MLDFSGYTGFVTTIQFCQRGTKATIGYIYTQMNMAVAIKLYLKINVGLNLAYEWKFGSLWFRELYYYGPAVMSFGRRKDKGNEDPKELLEPEGWIICSVVEVTKNIDQRMAMKTIGEAPTVLWTMWYMVWRKGVRTWEVSKQEGESIPSGVSE